MQTKKNLIFFRLYKILFLYMIVDPIFFTYAYSLGLTVGQIYILSSIQTALIIILEIPTGIVSDMYGCKVSIILGILSYIFSNVVVLIYPTFTGFSICSVLIAFYKVFISGADEAYLYLILEDKSNYTKESGSLDSINFILTGIASISVGYIFSFNKKYPFILSILACTVALFMANKLENVKEKKEEISSAKELYKEFINNAKNGFIIVSKSKKLKWFMLYSAIVSFSLVAVLQTYQLYFLERNIDVRYFGWIYFGLYISSSICSKISYLFKRYNVYKCFMVLLGMLILTPLIMSIPNIIFFFAIIIPRIVIGIYPAMIREYINDEIAIDRATIFSIRSLLTKVMQVVLLPLIGVVIDNKGLDVSLRLIFMALLMLFFGLIISLHLMKIGKKTS